MTQHRGQGWLDDGLRGQIEDGQQGTPERTKQGSRTKKRKDANWTNGDLEVMRAFGWDPKQMLARRAASVRRIEEFKEWVRLHPGETIPEDHPLLRPIDYDDAVSGEGGPGASSVSPASKAP